MTEHQAPVNRPRRSPSDLRLRRPSPEQPEQPDDPKAPAKPEARKTNISTLVSVGGLVVSIVAMLITAFGAHQSLQSSQRQATEALRASAVQADENFRRGEQKTAYADFLQEQRVAETAMQDLASAIYNAAPGTRFDEQMKAVSKSADDILYQVDLIGFVSSDATYIAADKISEELFNQQGVVSIAASDLTYGLLGAEEKQKLMDAVYKNSLPDLIDSFNDAARTDIDAFGQRNPVG